MSNPLDIWPPVTGTGGPPTGAAGGDLAGAYPNPNVIALKESGGADLPIGAIGNGQFLKRVGGAIVGAAGTGGGGAAQYYAGSLIPNKGTNLWNASVAYAPIIGGAIAAADWQDDASVDVVRLAPAQPSRWQYTNAGVYLWILNLPTNGSNLYLSQRLFDVGAAAPVPGAENGQYMDPSNLGTGSRTASFIVNVAAGAIHELQYFVFSTAGIPGQYVVPGTAMSIGGLTISRIGS